MLAAGLGKPNEDGKRLPLDVKAGDIILFGKYSGQEIKLDGVEYLIMKEEDVLAIQDAAAATNPGVKKNGGAPKKRSRYPPSDRGTDAMDRDKRRSRSLHRRPARAGDGGRTGLQRTDRALRKPGTGSVIDPARVVRSAMQNAASIASLLLTTEAVISRIPEQQNGAVNDHYHA